ncbi:biotin synthase BioB [Bartonella sp. DGB2]|uniref:biotin synthase BioB n=1 Tax=Bartonella sp. DGB2 TaxID=3388426 RepID=UPI00399033BE
MSETTDLFRYDWQISEIEAIYRLPVLDLLGRANAIHRQFHTDTPIQKASLLSIKTGGCPEDCSYCSQSARNKEVELTPDKLMDPERVIALAKRAKEAGANRFCMAAAWRQVKDGKEFEAIIRMIEGIRALDMEACVTLGMLQPHQAQRLKQAGLTAYNHNLDTSPEFYGKIITTRTYQDRLDTIKTVRDQGIEICCGGIIGLGESITDRASLLCTLATMNPHPESVPINTLVAVPGTPLAHQRRVDSLEHVRMIATARILMPKSYVRLAAGRSALSREAQILCFMAGANSLFLGDKLLTTPNNEPHEDEELFFALAPLEKQSSLPLEKQAYKI